MAITVIMPALEMAQETGKILHWRKKEGERVAKGESLFEIETDKAVVEIEATGEGILAGVTAFEGAVIPVGQTIAWLLQPGEALPKEATGPQLGRRTGSQSASANIPDAPDNTPVESHGAEMRISPKARRLAREFGVDMKHVRGSGSGGEILAADIEAATPQTHSATATERVETPGAVGRLMAERTAQSWTTIPHFFVLREVEAGGLVVLREKLTPEIHGTHGVNPTYTDLLVALVGRVLLRHPRINASWSGNDIRLHPAVNMGIAMAVDGGVAIAVIQNAAYTSLGQLAVQRRDLAERARSNRLRPSDITGATFTISNLGMYHVDAFTAIIVPPQAAILAVGAIADRVVPVDGQARIRPMITITLSCDHRIVDGARAAMFLDDVAEAIHKPAEWLR